ncbi:MAG: hypothetical protein VZR53_11110 [Prevotella sp.]|nr:hypothetical protein [Prevotella sp.]
MSLTSIFQDIADAIRSKTGKSESIYPVDMASEIEGIESGGGYKLEKMPSGAVSSFNDGTDLPLNKLKVSIEPVQDLHGYDAPWAGGAGKNKFQTTATSRTQNGVTWTVNNDGTITVSGSATDYTELILGTAKVTTSMGKVTISGISGTTNIAWSNIELRDANNNVLYLIISGGTNASFTVDLSQYPTADNIMIRAKRNNNGAVSGTIKPQVELGQAVTTFAPYSNICPISGWDEVNVTVANDVDNPTISNVYTIDLEGTHYGGTLDVVSGVLTVTNANIVSYNGEIINEPWISSMDVYSAGATPTTGAQVVYPLATPQTIQLTPTAVRSLIELNNIWADTGDIINGEYFKGAGTRPTS